MLGTLTKAGFAAVILAAAAALSPLKAQDYPTENVTVIVALGAGGSMDVITRLYGEKLAERFGKPFIVDNRGGAGGIMGTICRQLPPLRLIRKPRRSATISSGRTSPTEGLAPKIHAMMTTLSVAVPARPDFDSPMHIAPKRARSSIQPLAGRSVWAESQSSIRGYLPAPVSNTKTSNGSSVTVTFSPAARRKVRRRWSA